MRDPIYRKEYQMKKLIVLVLAAIGSGVAIKRTRSRRSAGVLDAPLTSTQS